MAGQHISELPLTAASISSVDSVNCSEGWAPSNVNNAFRAFASMVKDDFARSANTITAASTFTLASISTGDYVRMAPPSGASITSFGPATDGLQKFLHSTGTTILRNGASLSVQGGADITRGAGDLVWARRDQSVWKARIQKADGSAAFNPAFLAHKNGSNQSSITATAVLVTFGTEEWDVGGYFASDTWTPPAGRYRITSVINFGSTNAVDAEALIVSIYKNGSVHRQVKARRSGASDDTVELNIVVEANGSDTFDVRVQKSGAGAGIVDGTATATWFCGERI
jgi:hypothetical protein